MSKRCSVITKPYSDNEKYTCKLCPWPSNSKELDGSSFEAICWAGGAPGSVAMKHIEKHHPVEAKEIYEAMRNET